MAYSRKNLLIYRDECPCLATSTNRYRSKWVSRRNLWRPARDSIVVLYYGGMLRHSYLLVNHKTQDIRRRHRRHPGIIVDQSPHPQHSRHQRTVATNHARTFWGDYFYSYEGKVADVYVLRDYIQGLFSQEQITFIAKVSSRRVVTYKTKNLIIYWSRVQNKNF